MGALLGVQVAGVHRATLAVVALTDALLAAALRVALGILADALGAAEIAGVHRAGLRVVAVGVLEAGRALGGLGVGVQAGVTDGAVKARTAAVLLGLEGALAVDAVVLDASQSVVAVGDDFAVRDDFDPHGSAGLGVRLLLPAIGGQNAAQRMQALGQVLEHVGGGGRYAVLHPVQVADHLAEGEAFYRKLDGDIGLAVERDGEGLKIGRRRNGQRGSECERLDAEAGVYAGGVVGQQTGNRRFARVLGTCEDQGESNR